MESISFITTCMGRLSFLRETLPRVVAQRNASVVVVDYSCPDRCGEWVARNYPDVTVVSVPGEKVFSYCRARNAGANAAAGDWLCFFDADIVLAPSFTDEVRRLLEVRRYLRPHPVTPPTFGTFVCARRDFLRVGGYDDIMQGSGNQNGDLFGRLQVLGYSEKPFPADLVNHIDHSDQVRTENYELKDKMTSHTINRVYMVAKLDLWRNSGRYPGIAQRRSLYEKVRTAIIEGIAGGRPALIKVELSRATLLVGHGLSRSLEYRVDFQPRGPDAINLNDGPDSADGGKLMR